MNRFEFTSNYRYSAHSKIIYGLKVDDSDTVAVRQVRACNHDTDLTKKFCGECGKPIYIEKKIALVDEGYAANKIGYFKSCSDSDNGIIGFIVQQTKSNDIGYYRVPEISEQNKQKLIQFLATKGIEFKAEDLDCYLYTYQSY